MSIFLRINEKMLEEKINGKIHHNSIYRLYYHIDSVITFCNSSVSKNKTKQERELEDREQEEFMSSLRKTE